MTIKLDQSEPIFPDLDRENVRHTTNPITVALLDHGMACGAPSVAFRIDLDDGTSVIAETSAKLFVSAANAINARHPDLLS